MILFNLELKVNVHAIDETSFHFNGPLENSWNIKISQPLEVFRKEGVSVRFENITVLKITHILA